MTLLAETTDDIMQSGHTPEDIVFIGSEMSGHACSWEDFQRLADIEYDNGFGAQEIASDLIIVFSDSTKMWRHEYDGSEGWKYSKPFTMPTIKKPIARLKIKGREVGWKSLAEMNK